MNFLANGKISDNTPFREVWVQAAVANPGVAMGVALPAGANQSAPTEQRAA